MVDSQFNFIVHAVASVTLLTGIMNQARSTNGNELVFDNLRTRPINNLFLEGDSGDFMAQQFPIGNNTAISEVSMVLSRTGQPDGVLHVEIWDDSGEATPGSQIVRIATIEDLDSVPTTRRLFSFDTRITGLVAEQPYYVVLNFEDGEFAWPRNTIGWNLVGPDEGTFGAGGAMSLGDFFEGQPTPRLWTPVADDAEDTPFEGDANFFRMRVTAVPELAPFLQAGDADQDLDFDQLDLVQVQVAAKYLSGEPATWGEGDWDGAPGGEQGSPPAGDGRFDQLDIVSALAGGVYLAGPYAALSNVPISFGISELTDEAMDVALPTIQESPFHLVTNGISDPLVNVSANLPPVDANPSNVDMVPIPEPKSVLLVFTALVCATVVFCVDNQLAI